ncbi:cysteine proteinase [Backusella circina FSU 941]|nr:cysteine proteinase [Backusella circina FSU 941]
MIRRYGVRDVVVKDVPTLNHLANLTEASTYGIVLYCRYMNAYHDKSDDILFREDSIYNARITLSLVNILTNMDIGKDTLVQKFLEFNNDLHPINRAKSIEKFRQIHNSYGKMKPKEEDNEPGAAMMRESEGIYHCVSYVVNNGYVLELDSLYKRTGIVELVKEGENWLDILKRFLHDKIKSEFLDATLLAVVKDPTARQKKRVINPDEDEGKEKCKRQRQYDGEPGGNPVLLKSTSNVDDY